MRFFRFLIGAVFCISALFKLQDPVGLQLIMQDYFNFFHLGFLAPLAKVTGLVFAGCEAAIGVLLVSRYKFRVLDIATSCFIVFFTLLTLILLIVNPDIECGCFGAVIPLSHLGTFLKNLVLLALGGLVFWRAFTPSYLSDVADEDLLWGCRSLGVRPNLFHRIKAVVLAVLVLGFSIYSLIDVPLKDFTLFSQGSYFVGAAEDESAEMYFLYEKGGVVQEFTLVNLPDSTWNFVDIRAREVEGRPVLSVRTAAGEYIEDEMMDGPVVIVSMYKNASKRRVGKAQEFVRKCVEEGLPVFVVSDREYPRMETSLFSDRKTLLSLNRANLGATYIYDGRIISKYAPVSYPSSARLSEIANEESEIILLEQLTPHNLVYNIFCLLVAVLMLI